MMINLILFLAILAVLAIFALQNLSPIALTVLGIKTLALPLAVWVIGAILAGAFTMLLVSGLFSLSRVADAPRRPRPRSDSTFRPFGGIGGMGGSSQSRNTSRTGFRAASSSRSGDDWESGGKDEWDDWEEAPASARGSTQASAQQTPIRDREDTAWADWDNYEASRARRRRTYADEEVEDTPRRTDFEVPQDPVTRQQAGSVYSYSYRKPEDAQDSDAGKSEAVYDADYRVITPPYRPDPEDSPSPPPASNASSAEDENPQEEDWGLGDEPIRRDGPIDRRTKR